MAVTTKTEVPQLPKGFGELFFDMSTATEATEGVSPIEFLDVINAWNHEYKELVKATDWSKYTYTLHGEEVKVDPEDTKNKLHEFFAWSLFKAVGKREEHQSIREHVRMMFPNMIPKEFVWEAYGDRLNFEDAKSKYEEAATKDWSHHPSHKELLIEEAKHLARKEMNYDYAMDHKEDPDAFPLFNQRIEDYIESLMGEWEFEFATNVFDFLLEEKQEELEEETKPPETPPYYQTLPDYDEREFEGLLTPSPDDDEAYYHTTHNNIKDFFRNRFYDRNAVYDMQGATTKKALAGLVKAGGYADIMFDVETLANIFKPNAALGIVTTDHGTYLNRLASKSTNFWDLQNAKKAFNQFVPYVKKAFTLTEGDEIKDSQGNIIENPSESDIYFSKGGKYGYIPNADGELVAYEISNKTQLGAIASKVSNLSWVVNLAATITASKSRLIDRAKIMNEEVSGMYDYIQDRYPNLYKTYLTESNPVLKQEAEMTIAKGIWQSLVDKGGDWYGSGKFFNNTELTNNATNYLKNNYEGSDKDIYDENKVPVSATPQVGSDQWESMPIAEFLGSGRSFYYNEGLGMGSYEEPLGYGHPQSKASWVRRNNYGQIIGQG